MSPALAHLLPVGQEAALYLSLGGLQVPFSGQESRGGPQASWLGVPTADSQRGRERAYNLISPFVSRH